MSTNALDGTRYWTDEDFPIMLKVDEEVDKRYLLGLTAAAAHWNYRVGREFLQVTLVPREYEGQNTSHIRVSEMELGDNVAGKRVLGRNTFYINRRGRFRRSSIEIDANLHRSVVYEVILHEIGHALGLGHDNYDPQSVMHPYVIVELDQLIKDDDAELVRNYVPNTLPLVEIDIGDPFPEYRTQTTVEGEHPCRSSVSYWLRGVLEGDGVCIDADHPTPNQIQWPPRGPRRLPTPH